MPDTRKPSRPSRDPRLDSSPPAALGEAPLDPTPSAVTVPPAGVRVATLQAEVERLRAGRETDADETAECSCRSPESDRMRAAALSEAMVAGRARRGARRRISTRRGAHRGARGLRWPGCAAVVPLGGAPPHRARGDIVSPDPPRGDGSPRRAGRVDAARTMRDTLRALGRDQGSPTDAKTTPSAEPASGPESSVEESSAPTISNGTTTLRSPSRAILSANTNGSRSTRLRIRHAGELPRRAAARAPRGPLVRSRNAGCTPP